MQGVYAAVADPLLQDALIGAIRRFAGDVPVGIRQWDDLQAGNVVVTSSNDCSLTVCADLSSRGIRVIVLAPLPTAAERDAYQRAGSTAYLAMEVNHEPLRVAISLAQYASG
ncbi:MAG: hypothetical protein AB7T37_11630 [Dehalococcoidia bacterium]